MMTMTGTLLPSAEAASCPQLAEGDIRALGQRTGFDPQRTNAAAMQQFFGTSAALSGSVLCAGSPSPAPPNPPTVPPLGTTECHQAQVCDVYGHCRWQQVCR